MKTNGKASPLVWLQKASAWLRLKKWKRELRNSEKFQKECERLRLFTLAELEESYRVQLQEKIRRQEASLK